MLDGFERAGCEVSREGDGRLSVMVPGWDSCLFPSETAFAVQRWFWDRMIVTVDEKGAARFRLVYFSPPQLLLHVIVSAIFALEAWCGGMAQREPARFALILLVAQLVPLFTTLAAFNQSRAAITREAFRATS